MCSVMKAANTDTQFQDVLQQVDVLWMASGEQKSKFYVDGRDRNASRKWLICYLINIFLVCLFKNSTCRNIILVFQ